MKPGARQGRPSLSPVLVVNSVEEETAFLQTVLRAEIGMLIHNTEGEVQRAEAHIGDSILLLQRASEELPAKRSVLHIPVSDVQATLQLALDNGGESVPLPGSASRREGEAAVRDPQGNVWWIVPLNRKPTNEEVQRRLTEQRRQRL